MQSVTAASVSTRNAIIERYQNYVHGLVRRLMHTMGLPPEMLEEYVAAGYLGLVEAAERFDAESGVEFKSFACLRIRGAVIDCIRTTSVLSSKAYRYIKALQAAQDLREGTLTKPVKDSECLFTQLLGYVAQSALVFKLSTAELDQEAGELISEDPDPEEALEQTRRNVWFHNLVASLPPKERIVIEGYYFREKSFAEIAKENKGFSKSWVSRLHTRGIDILRKRLLQSRHEENSTVL